MSTSATSPEEPAPDDAAELGDASARGSAAGPGTPVDHPSPGPDAAELDAAISHAAEPDPASGQEPTARAARRERFRTILGALSVLACLAVAVFYALSAPDPDLHPGARGVALRWGVPALWVLLAVTLTTWTMRLPEKVTRLLSYLVLACFVFYMVLRAW